MTKISTSSNLESHLYDGEILEGILQGKKGMIGDVNDQISNVNNELSSYADSPGMKADVQRLQNEVTQISAKMGNLSKKPNREIDKKEIKDAITRLTEISAEAKKIADKMLKQDVTNKEAAAILTDAQTLALEAVQKESNYLQKKADNIEKERNEKIKVKISTDRIDYDPDNTKVVNPEVKKFQELVVDKFGKIKQIADLPQFKMMGTDGKFGKGTRDIVIILKKGFGLPDSSKDITKELIDEIQTQVIKESKSNVLSFEGYVSLYEDFNVSVAIDAAKSLPSYTQTSAKSAAQTSAKSAAQAAPKEVAKTEVKKEVAQAGPLKQALTNGEIQNIAKELIDASNGGTNESKFLSAIEKLKNKTDFSILNGLLSRSYKETNYQKQKEMGLTMKSTYPDLQSMINGEMGSDDTGTVRLIKNHLIKIGVNASYRYLTKNKEYVEDSFSIK